ncbi:MAG: hypothetical protein BWY95_00597 [Bacteroidetes bacterium ADurb.BinA104]|jgi:hypothetical protein|nr:MAG: hypothetical protein BWY95_00597 [Bacteroidetes bacterium ADurb.BinA104]
MHIGVLEKILKFALLVTGIHRYTDGANLCAGIEECKPVGYILRPESYMGPFSDPYGYEAARHIVNAGIELFPRESQITVGIDDTLSVGGMFGPILQIIAQGLFRQL